MAVSIARKKEKFLPWSMSLEELAREAFHQNNTLALRILAVVEEQAEEDVGCVFQGMEKLADLASTAMDEVNTTLTEEMLSLEEAIDRVVEDHKKSVDEKVKAIVASIELDAGDTKEMREKAAYFNYELELPWHNEPEKEQGKDSKPKKAGSGK